MGKLAPDLHQPGARGCEKTSWQRAETQGQDLLAILSRNPCQNPPPFEKLVGDVSGAYSRRINIQHRLVYQTLEEARTVKVSELALLQQATRAAKTTLLFPPVAHDPDLLMQYGELVRAMHRDGIDAFGTLLPRAIGLLSGLDNGYFPVPDDGSAPTWTHLKSLAPEQRLALIRTPAKRQALISEASANPRWQGYAGSACWLGKDEKPDYTRSPQARLAAMAKHNGEHPAVTWLDLAIESDGRALYHHAFSDHGIDLLIPALQEDWCLPGLGDAGTHLGYIHDSGWTTFTLSYWYRERGLFTLPEVIRKMSAEPARALGLTDRGQLTVGAKADVNVIDIDRVEERQPCLVADMPLGARRFVQKAVGYDATLCNGRIIHRHDAPTGERGGAVLRRGQ
jgi:N-acyl-D-amino-acid deacylase